MPKFQITCQFLHMPNSYQIYICSIHVVLHVCQFYANLHIYQVSCRFTYVKIHDLHVYKAMLNLHRSSFIPKITCITCLHQFTHNKFQPNYIYQDPCQISYANPHSCNYHYNDNTQISSFTLMVVIPKYPIFMLCHQFHQTHIFHQAIFQYFPHIPSHVYRSLGLGPKLTQVHQKKINRGRQNFA